jgi:hypothetical protein
MRSQGIVKLTFRKRSFFIPTVLNILRLKQPVRMFGDARLLNKKRHTISYLLGGYSRNSYTL